jgi:hypothetical protein
VRSTADQILALFDYLAGLHGRGVAVERTAGSLLFAERLYRMFEHARFVHFYRYGPDCALSMSTHPAARPMALMEQAGLLGRSRQGGAARTAAPPELMDLLTPPVVMRRVMAYPAPPLAVFGRLWSRMIIAGLAALHKLPSGSWMPMKYEDVLGDPRHELSRLAEFIGSEPSPAWLEASARMVDVRRRGRAAKLGPAAHESLLAACEPGLQALNNAGHLPKQEMPRPAPRTPH